MLNRCLFLFHRTSLPVRSHRSFASTSTAARERRYVEKLSKPLRQPLVNARLPRKPTKTTDWADRMLKSRLLAFRANNGLRHKIHNIGIKGGLYKKLSAQFINDAKEGSVPGCDAAAVLRHYNADEGLESIDRVLFSSFLSHAEPQLPQNIRENIQALKEVSDLRFPSEWFPEARQMQRKVILHVGPTNSGKTYHALNRLAEAQSGIYCGPLRLLAHEIFNKMNARGVGCNLLTGEERREVSPFAPLTSSTIEMANLRKPLEVAVIDEIQMIADPHRGWAWTQALLGLQAKEIHLCGEASVVPLIKDICKDLNDEVVVNEYKRLTPVTVMKDSLNNDWKRIRKGDCVVTFSRREIFAIKSRIEKERGLQCAVVYGGLPPELRASQAQIFNDPTSDTDVMVASDAVGMGLNLNIKRVVFHTVQKFDGKNMRFISYPQLKQIGGRAGRFGTAYASGEVTTMNPQDLSYVKEAMASPTEMLSTAGLQPTIDIIELFALQMPNEPFSKLIQKFEDLASLSGKYFLCNLKDTRDIANLIDHIQLGLRDRYQFVFAPVPLRQAKCVRAFQDMVDYYSQNKRFSLEDLTKLPEKAPSTPESLSDLESSHKIIMLYMWLSLRFPEHFITPQDEALKIKLRCETLIDESLRLHNMKHLRFKRKLNQPHSIAEVIKKKFHPMSKKSHIHPSK
ncbi:P-loop containing nucleoside triphosphate hydrolase protein [Dichotomocladium elegans]|nr:P-loop containing nucleoside triphosphate hydrolase protein [Dichotomocladium elegans]